MSILIEIELPKRLATQREGLGYTFEELAARTSFTVDALQSFERSPNEGGHLPALHELSELGWALGIDPMVLLSDEGLKADPARSTARFRSQDGAKLVADDRRLLAIAAEVGRVGKFLWPLVRKGKPSARVGTNKLKDDQKPWEQGYELGEASRRKLLPGEEGPIPNFRASLETLGVHVAWAEFKDQRIDAATVAEPDALPVLVVNTRSERLTSTPSYQRSVLRSIIAHELCHVLHDGNSKRNPLTMVTVAHGEDSLDGAKEQRANAFAPSFLAPMSFLDIQRGFFPVAEDLVMRWFFTPQGAANHAKNIFGLDSAATEDLERKLKLKLKTTRSRPQAFEEPLPPTKQSIALGLVGTLAHEAHRADLITQGRLNEILRMA